jgi:isopentenyl diphosphate isomerase/L-lactate dehydrogenase-like FMN-dependent dehydrogenase
MTSASGSGSASDSGSASGSVRDWSAFQYEIYLNGLTGAVPRLPTDLTRLEDLVAGRLGPGPAGYVIGSAGSGSTARANRAALERWRIVPRMLRDVQQRDLSVRVLGRRLPAPLALAPVGVLSILHPDAEPAAARAAAAHGVPFIASSAAGTTMEQIAEAAGDGERWFQLYWPRDREVTESFLARAKASGYSALFVTLDTWLLAWRPRDLDQAYLPFLHGVGTANYFADPAFRAGLAKPVEEDRDAAVLHFARMFADPTKTWSDLAFLREHWDGPIVLKGILHPDDARRAADVGMDGIVVSNHGGRQVNGSIAALDALPAIAAAVGDRLEVLFDSGIRTGDDIVKALALGARAVLLGRPYAYGLALDGQSGVDHVIRCLLAELDLTLALSGHTSPDTLTPDILTPDSFVSGPLLHTRTNG